MKVYEKNYDKQKMDLSIKAQVKREKEMFDSMIAGIRANKHTGYKVGNR